MKIATVVGARPQFIKAAVVSRQIRLHNASLTGGRRIFEYLIHTGQHHEHNMSEVFFEELDLPKPDICLSIHGLSHGAMTGRMIEGIENVLLRVKPDVLLVYGDTNSTLAGALAAVKLHIPVAHVEAGLRSFNRMMPEEHNRVLTDHISTFLFCPSDRAVENLRREGIAGAPNSSDNHAEAFPIPRIFQVGDVMCDAALFYAAKAKAETGFAGNILDRLALPRHYALATLHRAENTDSPQRLGAILKALETISEELPLIWPVHPRTRQKIAEHAPGLTERLPGIRFTEPVGYSDMIELLQHCRLVLTDSGGLQKEAYFFNKPCVTLREETEWVELVDHGFNKIAGVTTDGIAEAFRETLAVTPDFNLRLYGNGDTGSRILSVLSDCFAAITNQQ